MTQPTLINLHPNLYSQEFHYYSFSIKLEVARSCNIINDLSNKACIPNKTRFKAKGVRHDYRNK